MGQLRDRNAVLMPNEIEAIKVTQEVIKRMADNSAKTKTVFLALFAAAVTLHKSITIDVHLLAVRAVPAQAGDCRLAACPPAGVFYPSP